MARRKRLQGGGLLRRGHLATCRQGAVEEQGMAGASHRYSVAGAEYIGQQLVIWKPGLSSIEVGSHGLLCFNHLLTPVYKVRKRKKRK